MKSTIVMFRCLCLLSFIASGYGSSVFNPALNYFVDKKIEEVRLHSNNSCVFDTAKFPLNFTSPAFTMREFDFPVQVVVPPSSRVQLGDLCTLKRYGDFVMTGFKNDGGWPSSSVFVSGSLGASNVSIQFDEAYLRSNGSDVLNLRLGKFRLSTAVQVTVNLTAVYPLQSYPDESCSSSHDIDFGLDAFKITAENLRDTSDIEDFVNAHIPQIENLCAAGIYLNLLMSGPFCDNFINGVGLWFGVDTGFPLISELLDKIWT